MTKRIKIGSAAIGGGESIKIQSMCTTRTADVEKTCAQIARLEAAGCEIIRVSVLDEADAKAIKRIRENIKIPLVADIHFSHKLAVMAIESGCDKVRINPGNLGGERQIRIVADCIKAHKIPVRVGANSGSIEKEYLEKYGVCARSLVESAQKSVKILENMSVEDIVISVKASSVPLTVEAYEMLARATNYPLHLGVTEAGTEQMATIKSAAALGALLLKNIGDTIRVSITDDPEKEVRAARRILRAIGLDDEFADVISCPTCGRCEWDSMSLAKQVADYVEDVKKPLKIAVMGCVVNGPGEARECDLGIAGAKDHCLIFKRGGEMRKVAAADAREQFFREIDELINN